MKILFTQFTPPFVQGVSSAAAFPERVYLEYSDWYSGLRRRTAAGGDEVKLVSLTRGRDRLSIVHDGYEAVFFPVSNPDEPIRDGRWDFNAPGLVDWVSEFDPDVVHVVGTGHLMAREIMAAGYAERTCLWERTALDVKKFSWDEYQLAGRLVFATEKARDEAARHLPGRRLLVFPLGANVTDFVPDPAAAKDFDVISVGRFTRIKHVEVVRDIVRSNGLSWLHAGATHKGWPFTGMENLLFASKMRKRLGIKRVKTSRGHPHTCGFFEGPEMPALYNRAKILVHPSVSEGAPRCVQEALACEVPVVVLSETVPYVEPSFGVACASHAEFDGAVMELLADADRRQEMGRIGRRWLVENHSPERLLEEVGKVNMEIKKMSGASGAVAAARGKS